MRISIVDYAGHPFQVQLSRKLAARNHDVLHLYFGQAVTPRGKLATTPDDPHSIDIEAVRIKSEYSKYSYIRRWWQEQLLAKAFVRRIERFQPEVVIVANAPLDNARAIQHKCLRSGVTFILWQQDVYSVAMATILEKNSACWALRLPDTITTSKPRSCPGATAWSSSPRRSSLLRPPSSAYRPIGSR